MWPDVVAMARAEKELSWLAKESLWPGFEAARWDVFTNRPVYGTPINQGPLAHTPTNELGVVYLFGAMARELGYVDAAASGVSGLRSITTGETGQVATGAN